MSDNNASATMKVNPYVGKAQANAYRWGWYDAENGKLRTDQRYLCRHGAVGFANAWLRGYDDWKATA